MQRPLLSDTRPSVGVQMYRQTKKRLKKRSNMISGMGNKIILIGGTSHCGKTTLAKNLSLKLNIEFISTDNLAKHPGRPWSEDFQEIPGHVRNHYAELSTIELMSSVLMHYENLWPSIRSRIQQIQNEQLGAIIEGSALLPQLVKNRFPKNITAVWLTAEPEKLKNRIYESSGYMGKPPAERQLIDTFVERTLAFDKLLTADLKELGLDPIIVDGIENESNRKNTFLKILKTD